MEGAPFLTFVQRDTLGGAEAPLHMTHLVLYTM
jgi:hypothetical protein